MKGNRPDAEDFFGISFSDYEKQRDRRFGTANPDLMDVPLWKVMIRHGFPSHFAQIAYRVREPQEEREIWTFDRRGMSSTELSDRRIIYIGGGFEDGYDPNFCIFNDVIVRHPDGEYDIYGYPKHDFAPTDYHTATLIEGFPASGYKGGVLIVGGLGYQEERIPGITNVHVLQLGSDKPDFLIRKVETSGENPGWIWDHGALLLPDGKSIIVFGGKVLNAEERAMPMDDVFKLDLATLRWEKVGELPIKEVLKSTFAPIPEPKPIDPDEYLEASEHMELPKPFTGTDDDLAWPTNSEDS